MKRVFVGIILPLIIGCSGSKKLADVSELKPWVGTWQGKELREDWLNYMQNWTLVLEIKDNKLAGKMSDENGEMDQVKLKDVKLQNGVLSFRLAFETSRGLFAEFKHRVRVKNNKMLSIFTGTEGGKEFKGKWEARRVIATENASK